MQKNIEHNNISYILWTHLTPTAELLKNVHTETNLYINGEHKYLKKKLFILNNEPILKQTNDLVSLVVLKIA